MRLTYLQFWTIIACVLLFILASVFSFWSYKISGSDKMSYTMNHTDSLFITKYNPNGNSIEKKLSQPANNVSTVKNNIKVTAAAINPIIENKAEAQDKPANQRTTRRYAKFEYDQSAVANQDSDINKNNDYSLSVSEIRAILAGYNREERSRSAPVNPVQTSNPVAGTKAFNDYVQKNRKSITDEDCANQHGKVILMFKVDNTGHPTDIRVFRSLCQTADREAVRLLQNGPNWTVSGDNYARCEVNF